jgi:hypothetical protein
MNSTSNQPTQPASDSATEGAKKLALILAPLLKEIKEDIINAVTAQLQEVRLGQADAKAQLDNLEKNVMAPKKTIKGDKKPANPGQPNPTPDDAVNAYISTYSNNKLVWFRNQWKTNEAFRNQFLTDDIKALMNVDPTITSRKDDQRKIAEATFIWNYAKEKCPELKTKWDQLHDAAKDAYNAQNKNAQQVAEPHTPPPETAKDTTSPQ